MARDLPSRERALSCEQGRETFPVRARVCMGERLADIYLMLCVSSFDAFFSTNNV
jgi:hypothetical protein